MRLALGNLARNPAKAVRAQLRLARDLAESAGITSVSTAARQAGAAVKAIATTLSPGNGDRERFSLPNTAAPPTPWNKSITAHRRFAMRSASLSNIKRLKDVTGGTVNDVVMAIVAGALREYLLMHDALPDRPLRAMVPVSIRTGDEDDTWTNRVSGLVADLPTDTPDPIERVARCRQAMDAAKRQFELVPADALADITQFASPVVATSAIRLASQLRLADRVQSPVNVIVSNVPGPRQPLYFSGARLEQYIPVSTVAEGMGLNITVHSYLDELTFGLISCRELVPDLWKMVDLHIDEIDRLFEATGAEWAVPPRPAPPRRGPASVGQWVRRRLPSRPRRRRSRRRRCPREVVEDVEVVEVGDEGAAPSEEASPGEGRELGPLSVFEHTVASFDPTATSILLWTRLSEDMTWASWLLAHDPELTDVVATGGASTGPDRDHTIVVDVDDLEPATSYWYRFMAGEELSPVGRTRTLPAGHVEGIRIGTACCARYSVAPLGVYRALAEREVDLVLHLGDYIYEDAGEKGPRTHDPPHTAITQDDYRRRLAQLRSDPDAQALHLRHPMVAIWDDHDLSDNAWRDGAKHHDPTRHGPWSVRAAAAAAARQEWLPQRLRDEADPKVTWRAVPIGDLAELVLLDTRLVGRDRQAGDDEGPSLDDPARSLLGDEQRAWLRERLLDMSRPWAIVASGVVVNSIELPWPRPLTSMNRLLPNGYAMLDGHVMHDDQWDGYPAEREPRGVVDRGAGRGGWAHRAAVRRRPLLLGVHRSHRFDHWCAGRGRVHDPGCLVGGDGSRPLPRAVAHARSRRQRARPRRMVRRDGAGLHDPRDRPRRGAQRVVVRAAVRRGPIRRGRARRGVRDGTGDLATDAGPARGRISGPHATWPARRAPRPPPRLGEHAPSPHGSRLRRGRRAHDCRQRGDRRRRLRFASRFARSTAKTVT